MSESEERTELLEALEEARQRSLAASAAIQAWIQNHPLSSVQSNAEVSDYEKLITPPEKWEELDRLLQESKEAADEIGRITKGLLDRT